MARRGTVRAARTDPRTVIGEFYGDFHTLVYLPTAGEGKYKAKQANDTFFVRFGDVLSAGLVFAGTTWMGFAPRELALANVGFILIWLGLAVAIRRFLTRLAATD